MKRTWLPPIILNLFIVLISFGILLASSPNLVLALQLTATPAADAGMYITVITDEPQINEWDRVPPSILLLEHCWQAQLRPHWVGLRVGIGFRSNTQARQITQAGYIRRLCRFPLDRCEL